MTNIYQLKITLSGSKPPIWRKILVTPDTTLETLHYIIQYCFDWECCHLYNFEINGMFIDDQSPEKIAMTLNALDLKEGSKFNYTYDFGDNWEHNIIVEKILSYDDSKNYPCCIKGKRAAPLEDSGGIWGYEGMLEILKDKEYPEYEDTLEWVGEDYDPEQFDIEEINEKLIANL